MREFKIAENLLVALGDYLVTKPFGEVAGLMNALQNLQQIEEVETNGNKQD